MIGKVVHRCSPAGAVRAAPAGAAQGRNQLFDTASIDNRRTLSP